MSTVVSFLKLISDKREAFPCLVPYLAMVLSRVVIMILPVHVFSFTDCSEAKPLNYKLLFTVDDADGINP